MSVKLVDKTVSKDSSSVATDASGLASILYTAPGVASLELDVSTTNATTGLISVGLSSSVNRTIGLCMPPPSSK